MNIHFFIYAHKDLAVRNIFDESLYTIIKTKDAVLNNTNNIKDIIEDNNELQHAYCEFSGFKLVYENELYKKYDYVGFTSYRKYFSEEYELDKLSELLREYDIIADNTKFKLTPYQDYNKYHNIEDLRLCVDIAEKKHNISQDVIDEYVSNVEKYHYLSFICKSDIFEEWIEFAETIIDEFTRTKNWRNMEDINNHIMANKNTYIKDYYNSLEAQSRILGFLAEFLFQLFIIHKGYKVYETKLVTVK